MTANFPGARPHGTLQDCEMDVTWQELMAITELQVAVHHPSQCKAVPPVQHRLVTHCIIDASAGNESPQLILISAVKKVELSRVQCRHNFHNRHGNC